MPDNNDVLTINQAGYLADLIRGVERGSKLRWYPRGSESADNPMKVVLRAFTYQNGNLYRHDADIRDAFVWCSGFMESWFPVRDLIKAMANMVNGRDGMDKPMAVIDAE